MWCLEADEHDQIREIILECRLSARFQPIVNLHTGEIYGYEGLIRGPENTVFHSPQELLRAATEAGWRARLELACHKVLIRSFLELGLPGQLFLNISPEVLVQGCCGDADHLEGLLDSGDLFAERIVMELTEGERIVNFGADALAKAVGHCRRVGYSLAIDDLGEGFSSLRLWSELRPAFVKIDRHFVQNIENDPVKEQFIRSILDIARQARCRVIAEGIETEAEMRVTKRLGMTYGQGYYFAKPMADPEKLLLPDISHALFHGDGKGGKNNEVCARDTIAARNLVHQQSPVRLMDSNDQVLRLLEKNPHLDSLPVVDNAQAPVGLITRSAMVGSFAQPYRHELFGKKSCAQFMDPQPLLVEKTATVQDISRILSSSERRHLVQGFIVTDQGRYHGMAYGQDLIRVITDMQIQAAKYANPLTQLPGNVPIHEHLDSLLKDRTPFVACYCDLDHFKPYNDLYGFSAGDAIIQMTAEILKRACAPEVDFLGHIGGDDFIVLFQSQDWEDRCHVALREFEQGVRTHFTREDLELGGYCTENRQFEKVFHPLTSLSIGAVVVPPDLFFSYMEVSKLASGAKSQAKKMQGNALFINRRFSASG